MSAFSINAPQPWFRRWWGRVLVGVATLFALFAAILGGATAWYWWQLQHGQPVTPPVPLGGAFTSDGSPSVVKPVDRALLEKHGILYHSAAQAPVTIVEFVDFKCPNCLSAWPTIKDLKSNYGQKLKIIMRNFPLDLADQQLHPGATELAVAAVCADEQHRYEAMHELLFQKFNTLTDSLSEADKQMLAAGAGLDFDKFDRCLNDPASLKIVTDDYIAGVGFGVVGTPTFFINGLRVEGAVTLQTWQKYLSGLGY